MDTVTFTHAIQTNMMDAVCNVFLQTAVQVLEMRIHLQSQMEIVGGQPAMHIVQQVQ